MDLAESKRDRIVSRDHLSNERTEWKRRRGQEEIGKEAHDSGRANQGNSGKFQGKSHKGKRDPRIISNFIKRNNSRWRKRSQIKK